MALIDAERRAAGIRGDRVRGESTPAIARGWLPSDVRTVIRRACVHFARCGRRGRSAAVVERDRIPVARTDGAPVRRGADLCRTVVTDGRSVSEFAVGVVAPSPQAPVVLQCDRVPGARRDGAPGCAVTDLLGR